MRVVMAEQIREMDRLTIANGAASGAELMDRAGSGLAKVIRNICRWRQLTHPCIRMVAGKGNNGGDVYAAAYYLLRHFADLEIVLVGDPAQLQGEALWHYDRVREHVVCETMLATDELGVRAWCDAADIVVDGLLGTGATGAPRDRIASAIRAINHARANGALVVAVDVPSGMNANTGIAVGDAVVADFTVTMGLPKMGMLQSAAQSFLGCVDVIDIGIPASVVDEVLLGGEESDHTGENASCESVLSLHSQARYISGADVRKWLPPRARVSHKGTYGRVLVIGGAPRYIGAVVMAAQAACRSGAGLVYVLTPEPVAGRVAQLVPEAMVFAGKSRSDGGLASDALRSIKKKLPDIDTVLLGPGMMCHADGAQLIKSAYDFVSETIILDADALNVLAAYNVALTDHPEKRVILTPHPGEAARLLDVFRTVIQADRVNVVQRLAEKYHAVVVLKGAGTLISDGALCGVNLTGTPGMATGGSGDVLAGMIAALCAQVPGPWEAASAGVYVHGLAGNMAALEASEVGMTAEHLCGMVPKAFGWVLGR